MRLYPKHLIGGSLIALGAATSSYASSHREAPNTAGMPRIDSTDLYAFRSYEPGRENYVTLIANYIPFQNPWAGPNYYKFDEDAVYEIHVDNDGDAVEDLTFQFDFESRLRNNGKGITLDVGGEDVAIPLRYAGQITKPGDATINEPETYTVSVIEGDRRRGQAREVRQRGGDGTFRKPIDYVGQKTIPEYAAYANAHIYDVRIPGCKGDPRIFVGQRAEAFAVSVGEIFDLVNLVPIEGDSAPGAGDAGGFPGGITQNRKNDDLVGKKNVTSIALEVPISCLTGDGNGVIGAWQTSSLPRNIKFDPTPNYDDVKNTSGRLVQLSRLGNPLVNEVVIGLPDKDRFNSTEPRQDARFATYVTNPTLPALLDVLFRDAVNTTLGTDIENLAPDVPRNDLVTTFLTGFPGLNQLETVTPSEMMRLNTAIAPTPQDAQNNLGVIAGDLAGFPNGRRPGDDVVDIELRVVMGRLCYDLPIGEALGQEENDVNLGICSPEDAPVGNVPFTDGAPINATYLMNEFPYLRDPLPGSPLDFVPSSGN